MNWIQTKDEVPKAIEGKEFSEDVLICWKDADGTKCYIVASYLPEKKLFIESYEQYEDFPAYKWSYII